VAPPKYHSRTGGRRWPAVLGELHPLLLARAHDFRDPVDIPFVPVLLPCCKRPPNYSSRRRSLGGGWPLTAVGEPKCAQCSPVGSGMNSFEERHRRRQMRRAGTGTVGRSGGRPVVGNDGTPAALGRTACVQCRPSPATDYLVRGLAVDCGLDCRSPLLAVLAVFASAPVGAGWCDLSPPFDILLTSFRAF